MAMVDIQHLVEILSYVEAKSGRECAFRIREFFRRKPSFAGCSEFQLVAVFPGLVRGNNRVDFRKIQMSYSFKLVIYLPLLGGKLDIVGERLPLATSTDSEMLAERLQTLLRRLNYADYTPFGKIAFFSGYTYVNDVTGDCKLNKNDSGRTIRVISREMGVCNGLSFSSYVLNNLIF